MSSAAETAGASVREFDVQWGDLDSLGIVFYPHFYAWADEASHQMFRAAGLPLDRMLADRRVSFGLVSCSAEFHSPARYADRLVCRSTIVHRMSRPEGQPVATVREVRVCMDASEPGVIRAAEIPVDVVNGLKRFESAEAATAAATGRHA
jgi:YbgC/YbaW family acyl-CoA thioester hydrolase